MDIILSISSCHYHLINLLQGLLHQPTTPLSSLDARYLPKGKKYDHIKLAQHNKAIFTLTESMINPHDLYCLKLENVTVNLFPVSVLMNKQTCKYI